MQVERGRLPSYCSQAPSCITPIPTLNCVGAADCEAQTARYAVALVYLKPPDTCLPTGGSPMNDWTPHWPLSEGKAEKSNAPFNGCPMSSLDAANAEHQLPTMLPQNRSSVLHWVSALKCQLAFLAWQCEWQRGTVGKFSQYRYFAHTLKFLLLNIHQSSTLGHEFCSNLWTNVFCLRSKNTYHYRTHGTNLAYKKSPMTTCQGTEVSIYSLQDLRTVTV